MTPALGLQRFVSTAHSVHTPRQQSLQNTRTGSSSCKAHVTCGFCSSGASAAPPPAAAASATHFGATGTGTPFSSHHGVVVRINVFYVALR
jgi:hypothetical protein